MPEIQWRDLQVGDRVTLHSLPVGFLHPETRDIYRQVIQTQMELEVARLDANGLPWVDFEIVRNGEVEWHSLLINHEGLEICAE